MGSRASARAKRAKPEPAPVEQESRSVSPVKEEAKTAPADFSAAALRAIADKALARHMDFAVHAIPYIKERVQDFVLREAQRGAKEMFLTISRQGLWQLLPNQTYPCTAADLIALKAHITATVCHSWFPGCARAFPMVDEDGMTFSIKL